jgi:hypothetical protein
MCAPNTQFSSVLVAVQLFTLRSHLLFRPLTRARVMMHNAREQAMRSSARGRSTRSTSVAMLAGAILSASRRAPCAKPVVHTCSDRSKTACSKEGGSHGEGFARLSSSSLDPSSLWQGWQRRYGSLQVRGRRCGSARHTPSASAPPRQQQQRRRQRWRRLR